MNKLSGLVVAVSTLAGLCAPWAANADDIVSLSYQNTLTGTYSSLVSGLPLPFPFQTATYTGTLNGSVVFDETQVASGATAPISYSFTLDGTGNSTGLNVGFDSFPTPVYVYPGCNGTYSIGSCSSNGAVTGATVEFSEIGLSPVPITLSIEPQGDAVNFLNSGCALALEGASGATYTGPSMSICSLQAANSTAGTWSVTSTAAPEIDPGTAGSALTLLAGLAALARGRRRATAGP
ncbi:MAG TPA: hypothetical protein VGV09_04270 [Steroidobacteraceae bacterium]|nr:hypothetical protein [Steroidobacteraceae bacterium]